MTKADLAIIKRALLMVAIEENKAIDRVIAAAPTPPDSLCRRCDARAKEIIREQKTAFPTRKVIAVLIAATLIISMLGVIVYAARDKIGGFFVDVYEKFVELTTGGTDDTYVSPSNVLIEYIPDGFTPTNQSVTALSGTYDWEREGNFISIFFVINSNGSHSIDNENSNLSSIKVGDLTVFRTEKHGQFDAIWTDGIMVYTLSATGVEWDEMVKIIEGIKIKE